jgi:hypothetical protein
MDVRGLLVAYGGGETPVTLVVMRCKSGVGAKDVPRDMKMVRAPINVPNFRTASECSRASWPEPL